MSSINSRRDVGHGVGGGNASINNVAFSLGAWCGWLSDDEAFFVNGADGWVPTVYGQSTKQFHRAVGDQSSPLYGATVNFGFAGGGVWAGWNGSPHKDDPQRGLFTSTGLHLPDAGLLAVGPAGELAFKPNYQSAGPAMLLERAGQERVAAAGGSPAALAALEPALRAEGLYWQLSPGSPYDLQLLGAGRAIWQEGQRLKVVGIPQPLQFGRAWRPQAHLIGGRWWVSYYSDLGGLILHPFDELRGVTVIPPGVDAWHSARSFGSEVLFATFATEAEAAGWLREYLVDTSTAVLKPLVPPSAPLILPAPTRKYWSGWFEFASSQAGPGNAMVAVRHIAGALNRPAIVTNESEHLVSGTLLGRFITGPSVEEIEAAAKASTLRPVVYWDDRRWPRWPALPKGSWLCLQLYCPKSMTPAVFWGEAQAMIQAAPKGVPLVLVGQQYSSNATLVGFVEPSLPAPHDSEALKALAHVLVELANETPAVVALLLFSGYGRRGGLMDHPDLVEPWQVWSAQLQAPALEAYPPSAPVDPGGGKPPVDPPVGRFQKLRPYKGASMSKERGYLIGAEGLYLRGDASKVGIMGPGTFHAELESKTTGEDEEFELEERPDGHSARHVKSGLLLEMDATEYSQGLNRQYYLKSDGGKPPTGYAVLTVRQDTDGTVLVWKKYDHREENKPTFGAAGLYWVKK